VASRVGQVPVVIMIGLDTVGPWTSRFKTASPNASSTPKNYLFEKKQKASYLTPKEICDE
jgi:hypothetical protein